MSANRQNIDMPSISLFQRWGTALWIAATTTLAAQAFVESTPTIQGSQLIVEHPEGKNALHVRMGRTKEVVINLTNNEGLPAARTGLGYDEHSDRAGPMSHRRDPVLSRASHAGAFVWCWPGGILK